MVSKLIKRCDTCNIDDGKMFMILKVRIQHVDLPKRMRWTMVILLLHTVL